MAGTAWPSTLSKIRNLADVSQLTGQLIKAEATLRKVQEDRTGSAIIARAYFAAKETP